LQRCGRPLHLANNRYGPFGRPAATTRKPMYSAGPARRANSKRGIPKDKSRGCRPFRFWPFSIGPAGGPHFRPRFSLPRSKTTKLPDPPAPVPGGSFPGGVFSKRAAFARQVSFNLLLQAAFVSSGFWRVKPAPIIESVFSAVLLSRYQTPPLSFFSVGKAARSVPVSFGKSHFRCTPLACFKTSTPFRRDSFSVLGSTL